MMKQNQGIKTVRSLHSTEEIPSPALGFQNDGLEPILFQYLLEKASSREFFSRCHALGIRCFPYVTFYQGNANATYEGINLKDHPEFIDQYNIPIDEYIRRSEENLADWSALKKSLDDGTPIEVERNDEIASQIRRFYNEQVART